MGRKHSNARPEPKYQIRRNRHFVYSTDEFGKDASVVRYLGKQEGDYLYCWHPEGFALWIHVHQLSNPVKHAKAA